MILFLAAFANYPSSIIGAGYVPDSVAGLPMSELSTDVVRMEPLYRYGPAIKKVPLAYCNASSTGNQSLTLHLLGRFVLKRKRTARRIPHKECGI
jgi:hypothetical protein